MLLDTAEGQQAIQQDVNEAAHLAQNGQFDAALAIFTRLLDEYALPGKQAARLHHGRAMVYFQINNHHEAWNDCTAAIKLDPSMAEPHAVLGHIAWRKKHYVQASDFLTKALQRQPSGRPDWYAARAAIYLEQDRLEEASLDMAKLSPSILESPDGRILAARLALAGKKEDQAIEILKRAAETFPEHVGVLLLYANVLKDAKQFEESAVLASRVLAENPIQAKARHIRALSYLQLGRNGKAAEDFSLLIAQDPAQPTYYADRSLAYLRLENLDAALADCSAALKHQPDLVVVHYRRGIIFSRLEKYGPALAAFNQALNLDPRFGEAWFARAVLQDQSGFYPAAVEDYTKSLELNPDWAMAYCLRGRIYLARNNYAEARKDYDRALELHPDFGYAWFLKGRFLEKSSAYDEALGCYENALKLQKNDYTRLSRAGIRSRMGDLSGATDDYLKLTEVETLSLTARQRLADLFLKSGDWEKAWHMASEVLAQDDRSYDGHWFRAQAALQTGQLEVALEDADWLITHHTPSTDIWRLKGDVLSRLGRMNEAWLSYRKALDLFRGNGDAWLGKGLMEQNRNQPVEALESFRNAIRINPSRIEAYLGLAAILQTQVEEMSPLKGSVDVTSAVYDERLLERSQRIEAILKLYAEAEEKAGATLGLYLDRAEFLKGLGRHDAARMDVDRCRQLDPNHPRVLEMLSGDRP